MNRNNTLNALNHENLSNYKQKIAFHEAGHATAIHFINRQKNLPPIFFQITFKDLDEPLVYNQVKDQTGASESIARVNGGRLIQTLPIPLGSWDSQPAKGKEHKVHPYAEDYRLALEADIVNLLIGPLAEAKYVAQMDNEPFNAELLPVQALKHYGGEDDLAAVNDYLQSYSADKQEQDKNLDQFFLQAFNFVNDKTNWKAITRLAHYLLRGQKNRITCEEVAVVLDGSYSPLSC